MTENKVVVEQCDREAAADSSPYNERWGMLVRAGHRDSDILVQAFARHRTRALEATQPQEAVNYAYEYRMNQRPIETERAIEIGRKLDAEDGGYPPPIQAAESGLLEDALEKLSSQVGHVLLGMACRRDVTDALDELSKQNNAAQALLAKAGKPGEAGNG